MEILTITGHEENAALLRKMYRLRARVFAARLGWSVEINQGLEADEFDTPQTRYLLLVWQDRVVGCARFLDFARSTMIGSHFSALVDRPIAKLTQDAIESSRFCIDTETLRRAGDGLGEQATRALISAMIGWAALHHYGSIITVTDVRIERLLRRLDVPFERLGQPQRIETTKAIAGRVDVHEALACKIMPVPVPPILSASQAPTG